MITVLKINRKGWSSASTPCFRQAAPGRLKRDRKHTHTHRCSRVYVFFPFSNFQLCDVNASPPRDPSAIELAPRMLSGTRAGPRAEGETQNKAWSGVRVRGRSPPQLFSLPTYPDLWTRPTSDGPDRSPGAHAPLFTLTNSRWLEWSFCTNFTGNSHLFNLLYNLFNLFFFIII